MVHLTDEVMKNAYDKVINTFENVIDCNVHKQAYNVLKRNAYDYRNF